MNNKENFIKQMKSKGIKTALIASTTSIVTILNLTTPSMAQDNEIAIEEVIVTATRRSTSLADTPYSISAISEKSLDRQGADDFSDFVGSIPGLNLRDQGPGQSRPVIRGLQGSGEGQVAVYYNDAPIGGNPGTQNDAGRFSAELKPIDIERIEVLRGPQGTLYGGGSMGGTMRIITNKPQLDTIEGKVSAEISDYADGGMGYQLSGVINLPIIEDKLAIRAVAYYRKMDGFIDNVALGLDNTNDVETKGGRFSVLWQPSDTLKVTAIAYYQEQDLASGFHIDPNLDGYKTTLAGLDRYQDKTQLYNVIIEKSFDFADASYSYSHFNRKNTYRYFADVFVPSGILLVQPMPTKSDTHEFRLTSNNDGRLQWTTGLFYQNRSAFVESQVFVVGSDGLESGDFFFRRDVDMGLKQYAVFGEVSYELTDKLTATVGARWFDIKNFATGRSLVSFGGTPVPTDQIVPNTTEGGEKSTVFKGHLAYQVTEDFLTYFQFSQGFRAGGANQNVGTIAEIPNSFNSDSVDNYELGMRYSFAEGKADLNVALYRIIWSDIQTLQSDTTGLFRFIGNGGNGKIDGIEIDLHTRPTQNWDINIGFNYVDAKLSTDAPLNNIGGFSQTGLTGDRIPSSPNLTFNTSMEYSWQLNDDIRAYIFGSVQYTGESFSDFNEFLIDVSTNTPSSTQNIGYNAQGDYMIADLRIGIEGDDWSASLFVDNVLNKRAITNVLEDNLRPDPGFNFVEKPRSIGLSFTKDF